MAKGDIRIIDVAGRANVPVRTFPTRLGETAIKAGEPVMVSWLAGVQNPYVIVMTDATPVRSTDYFVGIAAAASSHTSSADGYVDVYLDLPGTVYAAKAKSAATWNTQKLVDNQTFYRIVFDLTSSSYTADVAADANRGLLIVGGEYQTYTVYFVANDAATWRGLNDK